MHNVHPYYRVPGVACLGIAANILAMRVFAAKKFHTFYRWLFTMYCSYNPIIFSLMMTLCMYDLIYLVCSMVIFSLPLLWPSIPSSFIFTHSIPYMLPIAQVAMTGRLVRTIMLKIFLYFRFHLHHHGCCYRALHHRLPSFLQDLSPLATQQIHNSYPSLLHSL